MNPEAQDDKERSLLAEYETVARFYSWAVSELSWKRGVLSREAYDKLFAFTEDARVECERVRSKLEELRKKHV